LADAIHRWRSQNRTVFVHDVAVQNRTALAGAAYLVRHQGLSCSQAAEEVTGVLPATVLNGQSRDVLRRVGVVKMAETETEAGRQLRSIRRPRAPWQPPPKDVLS
jgi:protein-tyrosine phosphatase